MALFNIPIFKIFKKPKPKEQVKPEVLKPVQSKIVTPKPKKRKVFVRTDRILKEPHITEKATDLVKKNQYLFKIWPEAEKSEIKKAIEGLYRVDVESVNTIKIPRKKRRLGKIKGWRKGYKKAIIRIKEGQKIEVLPR